MSFDGYDDEFYWNEHQWEAHLNELENRSEQLRKFINPDPIGNVPRWMILLQENLDEGDAVEAFIEEELLLDEAYFPDDEDDWDEDEDFEEDDLFFSGDDLPFPDNEDPYEDFEEGEEWKNLSNDFAYSNYGSILDLQVYSDAYDLAVDVLKWAESIPRKEQNKQLHEFVGNVLKISAKLAGGYYFGFDQDYLGGNIAYNKKALFYSNDALKLLQKQKGKPAIPIAIYKDFHSRLFEIRNDIGIYVQELRDYFRYGLG